MRKVSEEDRQIIREEVLKKIIDNYDVYPNGDVISKETTSSIEYRPDTFYCVKCYQRENYLNVKTNS